MAGSISLSPRDPTLSLLGCRNRLPAAGSFLWRPFPFRNWLVDGFLSFAARGGGRLGRFLLLFQALLQGFHNIDYGRDVLLRRFHDVLPSNLGLDHLLQILAIGILVLLGFELCLESFDQHFGESEFLL